MLGYNEKKSTTLARIDKKDKGIDLNDILSSIRYSESRFALNTDYNTIRYIDEPEFINTVHKYIEPVFRESTGSKGTAPRFLLLSVPEVTSKTTLAKYVCFRKRGVYWSLSGTKLAEYSFDGALTRVFGLSKVSEFVDSLKNGKSFFVVDGIDEAELRSGRTGIEFFLRDLNNAVEDSTQICAVLVAGTESAISIKDYIKFVRKAHSFRCGMDSTVYVNIDNIHIM